MKKSKAQKHEEALIRQKKYDSLSKEERLFQIEMRRGESLDEVDRLNGLRRPFPTRPWEKKILDDIKKRVIKGEIERGEYDPKWYRNRWEVDEYMEGWRRYAEKLQDHKRRQSPDYIKVQANWDKEMRERGQDGDKHTDWRKSLSKSKKEQTNEV